MTSFFFQLFIICFHPITYLDRKNWPENMQKYYFCGSMGHIYSEFHLHIFSMFSGQFFLSRYVIWWMETNYKQLKKNLSKWKVAYILHLLSHNIYILHDLVMYNRNKNVHNNAYQLGIKNALALWKMRAGYYQLWGCKR